MRRNEAVFNKAIAALQADENPTRIALECGVTEATIRRWAADADVSISANRKISPENLRARMLVSNPTLLDVIDAGYDGSMRALATEHDINYATLLAWVRTLRGTEASQRTRLTDEQIVEVTAMIDAGSSAADIAEKYEVAVGTVYSWTRAGRIPKPARSASGLTKPDRVAATMKLTGWTVASAARFANRAPATIANVVKAHDEITEESARELLAEKYPDVLGAIDLLATTLHG